MFQDAPGVGVVRRQIGHRVRRLREQSGLTQEHVAEALGRSRPTLWKIERADPHVTIRRQDLAILCEICHATAEETTLLLHLCAVTRIRGWAGAIGDLLPAGYDLGTALEDQAASIRRYEDRLVPELLQTEGYARLALTLSGGGPADDRLVAARMQRRALLTRLSPVRLELLLAEEVLRRPVGGAAVLAYQLARLAELADLPSVTIRVVPVDAGGHPGLATGGFSILGFAEWHGAPIVHTAGHAQSLWDRPADLARFDAVYGVITGRALDADASRELIRRLAAAG